MKRLMILAIWLSGSAFCLAQESGELQLTYQRIQSFTLRSGASTLNFEGVALNGGGYGFVMDLIEKFGVFQPMGFFGGSRRMDSESV